MIYKSKKYEIWEYIKDNKKKDIRFDSILIMLEWDKMREIMKILLNSFFSKLLLI